MELPIGANVFSMLRSHCLETHSTWHGQHTSTVKELLHSPNGNDEKATFMAGGLRTMPDLLPLWLLLTYINDDGALETYLVLLKKKEMNVSMAMPWRKAQALPFFPSKPSVSLSNWQNATVI